MTAQKSVHGRTSRRGVRAAPLARSRHQPRYPFRRKAADSSRTSPTPDALGFASWRSAERRSTSRYSSNRPASQRRAMPQRPGVLSIKASWFDPPAKGKFDGDAQSPVLRGARTFQPGDSLRLASRGEPQSRMGYLSDNESGNDPRVCRGPGASTVLRRTQQYDGSVGNPNDGKRRPSKSPKETPGESYEAPGTRDRARGTQRKHEHKHEP
jgi:hypothetical protein